MALDIHMANGTHPVVGPFLVAATPSGVVRVQFGDDEDLLVESLAGTYRDLAPKRASPLATRAVRALLAYLDGGPDPTDLPLVLPERGWSSSVWRALQRIPRGQVRTYGAVAKSLRRRGAARAVGGACGRNPLPMLVPCHRVVAADGGLGGFTGGLDIKRGLLRLEGALPERGRRRA